MTNKLHYYQEIKVGEGCSRCGGVLTVMSKNGKVFSVCLRCTSRELASRTSELKNRNLLRENR